MESKPARDIDDYISRYPKDVQVILRKMRLAIHKVAPAASERISYQIPTFYLQGNLVHFAAFSKHVSFFPTSSGVAKFQKELTKYKTSKGTIQFQLDQPIPYDLLRRIVVFRVKENLKRAKKKAKSKK